MAVLASTGLGERWKRNQCELLPFPESLGLGLTPAHLAFRLPLTPGPFRNLSFKDPERLLPSGGLENWEKQDTFLEATRCKLGDWSTTC